MKIWQSRADHNADFGHVREQGVQCLVNLREPILTKDGKQYRYLYGPVWSGALDTWFSRNATHTIQIGTESTANHIIIPFTQVLSIQECHKVLNNPEVLVLS